MQQDPLRSALLNHYLSLRPSSPGLNPSLKGLHPMSMPRTIQREPRLKFPPPLNPKQNWNI